MGTSAAIAIKRANGNYQVTRLNWDGYPSHTGEMLKEHYSEPEKAEELFKGELRSIEMDGSLDFFQDEGFPPIEVLEVQPWANEVGASYTYIGIPTDNKIEWIF